jgi:hypothetical protein
LAGNAIDIYWGSHEIDELDKIFLTDDDYTTALNCACAVVAYKQLTIYGAGSGIVDDVLFPTSHKNYESISDFYCCEVAKEYGRQLHYLIAQKAQEIIENDIKDEAKKDGETIG